MKLRKHILGLFLIGLLGCFFLGTSHRLAVAQDIPPENEVPVDDGTFINCGGGVKVRPPLICPPVAQTSVNLNSEEEFGDINPTPFSNLRDIALRFIKLLTGTVVLATILTFMIGGGYWIFSAGNESMVERGKDLMMYSLIGILLVLGSYVVIKLAQVVLYALST